jgi:phage protein D
MKNQALCVVFVEGLSIMLVLRSVLQKVTITDNAGTSSDTASITIDDSGGYLAFPRHNAKVAIYMGFRGQGISQVFSGTIDEPKSSGGRGGKNIEITAKGYDTSGKVKEPQQRHFDDKTVEDILVAAGETAGITDIRIDSELAGIVRDYEHMDDESFPAFGERLAKEIGGTFKIRNDAAVMAKKNSGRTPAGDPLPPVFAVYGENLHGWDIAPYVGRARYKQIRVRYYDRKAAKHEEVVVDTDIEGSTAIDVGRFEAPNKKMAEEKANSLKAESERGSGVGMITLEGNVGAQPEATCFLAGARLGIDGGYVIDTVTQTYSRGSGFVTKLALAYPL